MDFKLFTLLCNPTVSVLSYFEHTAVIHCELQVIIYTTNYLNLNFTVLHLYTSSTIYITLLILLYKCFVGHCMLSCYFYLFVLVFIFLFLVQSGGYLLDYFVVNLAKEKFSKKLRSVQEFLPLSVIERQNMFKFCFPHMSKLFSWVGFSSSCTIFPRVISDSCSTLLFLPNGEACPNQGRMSLAS